MIQVLWISYQDKIYLGIEEKQGSEAEDSIGPHPGKPVRLFVNHEDMDSLFPFPTKWEAHIIT